MKVRPIVLTDTLKQSIFGLIIPYPNDNGTDYMLLEDGYGFLTYKGEMKMEKISVVFSWPDSDEGEDTAMVTSL